MPKLELEKRFLGAAAEEPLNVPPRGDPRREKLRMIDQLLASGLMREAAGQVVLLTKAGEQRLGELVDPMSPHFDPTSDDPTYEA